MYSVEMKQMSIKELTEQVRSGGIIREGLQRTPSHDIKKASEILTSIFENKYSGALTFSKLDEGVLSVLDGSSRLSDFEQFVSGVSGYIKKLVYDSEKDREVVNKLTFNELSKDEQSKILSYKLPCIILTGVNNGETFVNLNSSTALSNIQKSKGNLKEEFLEVINTVVGSEIIKNVLSSRQLQKDEGVLIAFQMLANIYNVYSASNKKLVESVKATELVNFDLARLEGILSKFDNIEVDVNKYCLISLVSVLYNSPIAVEELPMFDNNIIYKVETQGANSAPANEKRLLKASKKLNEVLGVSVKTGRRISKNETELVEVEEIPITDTIDLASVLG